MPDHTTNSLPDPDLVEQVLSALASGVPPDSATLARETAATEAEVRAALDAIRAYEQGVDSERAASAASLDTTTELPPGTQLGDFVIEDKLSAGAMGVVYRARQVSLGHRVVALKVLPPALIQRDPRFVERFRREARLAATVHHPNLAEVYGFEEAGSALCFAMRLVEGRTLHDVLTALAGRHDGPRRPTSLEHVHNCVVLAQRLAGALAEIHAKGLVHRDVKPSNVLLEDPAARSDEEALTAQPVLVDFGLLRPAGDSTLTGTRTLLGTPAYASHEAQLGRRVDARTDVFSLGALLHDLVTLTSPSARAPATSGMPDARKVNPAVDARLAAILDMALQERKELRYADGGTLRGELDRYLRGEPVTALPTGVVGRARLWTRRAPAQAARAGAILLGAVVMIALLTWVAVWAGELTSIARSAARYEANGHLAEAAVSYRQLSSAPNVWILVWLADDLRRAEVYAPETGVLHEALEHLWDSERHRDGPGASLARTERELERAHNRLCEVLLDKGSQALGATIRQFLMREIRDGQTDSRRRVAMDTWADYLIHQEAAQAIPDGLQDQLRACIFDSQRLEIERETRRAAVAAYGAIREHRVLEDLTTLFTDEDREVVRLAYHCSINVYTWIHKTKPDEFAKIDPTLMARWAVERSKLVERVRAQPQGFRDTIVSPEVLGASETLPRRFAWILAWYEHNPESSAPPCRRLADIGALRERIDRAHREMRAFLLRKDRPDLEDPRDDADSSTDLAYYRQASGRAAMMHDPAIWRDDPRIRPGRATSNSEPGTSTFGAIDFRHLEGETPEPRLSGTVHGAEWQAAIHRPDVKGHDEAHLRFVRPGRSSLTVKSTIPEKAVGLTVRLKHYIGTRQELRRMGRATFRLSLKRSSEVVVAAVPEAHRTWGGHNLEEPSVSEATLTFNSLLERRTAEITVDYLHGNTTYWVKWLRLDWKLAPK